MPTAINEVGKYYKNFLVLSKDLEETKRRKRAYWICECQKCKTKKSIMGTKLRQGSFICETCDKEEKYSKEIGNQYGDFTIIDFVKIGQDRHYIWKCKCKCGNIEEVTGTALRSGIKQCCSECNKKKRKPQPNFIEETGNTYGLLKVIERDPEKIDFWICECQCGKKTSVRGAHLRSGHTQSCGCTRMSHGEIKIAKILKDNNIPFIQEYPAFNFEDTGKPARFDFYVDNQYFIEFDGETHFLSNLGGWHTKEQVEQQQKRDKIKTQWCLDNKIPLIRIPYTKYENLSLEDLIL